MPLATEAPSSVAALPQILTRAHEEIQAVLANLRGSRVSLGTAAVDNLQQTTDKLKQVTSATECATTDILDALDRAGALVDDAERSNRDGAPDQTEATLDQLRQEIFGIMGALQFQDITTQQLAFAASLLADTERSLHQITDLFGGADVSAPAEAVAAPDPKTFDPRASTLDAVGRQAVADTVFA